MRFSRADKFEAAFVIGGGTLAAIFPKYLAAAFLIFWLLLGGK